MMQHILIVKIPKSNISEMILKEKDYEIARYCKNDRCQRSLASMVYKIFDEKT